MKTDINHVFIIFTIIYMNMEYKYRMHIHSLFSAHVAVVYIL